MAEEGAVVPDEGGEEVEETPPPAPKYALELAAAGAAGAAAWALGAEPADGYVRALFFFLAWSRRARAPGEGRSVRGRVGRRGGLLGGAEAHGRTSCSILKRVESARALKARRLGAASPFLHSVARACERWSSFSFFVSSPPRHSYECAQPRVGVQSRVRRRAPTCPILNPRGARLRADVNACSDGCHRATPSCAAV